MTDLFHFSLYISRSSDSMELSSVSFPSSIASSTFLFLSSRRRMSISIVSLAIRYHAFTLLAFCPMRWTRSYACDVSDGAHGSSKKQTLLAAVRVIPTPAAEMFPMNSLIFFWF